MERMRHYIFYIRRDNDLFSSRLICDMLHEVKTMSLVNEKYLGKNPEEVLSKLIKLLKDQDEAEKALGVTKRQLNSDSHACNGMEMRARLNTAIHGPYLIKVPMDVIIDFEDIDSLIEHKNNQKVLEEFLDSAKM